MKKQNRIKKISLWFDVCELYKNPNDFNDNQSIMSILKLFTSEQLQILDFDIHSVSIEEAQEFEVE